MDLYRVIASGHSDEPPMLFAYPDAAAHEARRLLNDGTRVCVILAVSDEPYHAWIKDANNGRVYRNPAVEVANGQS